VTSTSRRIFDKTGGHCHFCGDRLVFKNRGRGSGPRGRWEIDHVRQRTRGGLDIFDNMLAACARCNRMRWSRGGDELRELLRLGLIAFQEMEKRSDVGMELKRLSERRHIDNDLRRARAQATAKLKAKGKAELLPPTAKPRSDLPVG